MKNATVKSIIIQLIIAAVGFYLAITTATAIKLTLDRYVVTEGDNIKNAWISVGIGFIIVFVSVYIIVRYAVKKDDYKKKQ